MVVVLLRVLKMEMVLLDVGVWEVAWALLRQDWTPTGVDDDDEDDDVDEDDDDDNVVVDDGCWW